MSDFRGRPMLMPRTRVMKKLGIAMPDAIYLAIVSEKEDRHLSNVSECIRVILAEHFEKKGKKQQ